MSKSEQMPSAVHHCWQKSTRPVHSWDCDHVEMHRRPDEACWGGQGGGKRAGESRRLLTFWYLISKEPVVKAQSVSKEVYPINCRAVWLALLGEVLTSKFISMVIFGKRWFYLITWSSKDEIIRMNSKSAWLCFYTSKKFKHGEGRWCEDSGWVTQTQWSLPAKLRKMVSIGWTNKHLTVVQPHGEVVADIKKKDLPSHWVLPRHLMAYW